MKSIITAIVFLMAFTAGCGTGDDGFRFEGEYSADRSGLVARIVSQGFRSQEGGPGGEAYAIVQVCPSETTEGRPVRMTFTATKNGFTMIECSLLGPVPMDWSTQGSEGLMRGLLASAGFRQIDPGELAGFIAAIGRGLGTVAQGRVQTSGGVPRVVREALLESHQIDHDKLPVEWVSPSEVADCQ
jgi:hypothetical protein